MTSIFTELVLIRVYGPSAGGPRARDVFAELGVFSELKSGCCLFYRFPISLFKLPFPCH